MLISFSNYDILEHVRAIFYNLQKDVFNDLLHPLIGVHFTLLLKGFVVKSQTSNLIPSLFFDHKSCISNLNEQCEGTLGFYTSKNLQ